MTAAAADRLRMMAAGADCLRLTAAAADRLGMTAAWADCLRVAAAEVDHSRTTAASAGCRSRNILTSLLHHAAQYTHR